jgi:hypothetical protein
MKLAIVLMFLASSASAQSVPADPISGLGSWLQSQQAQVGLSETLKGVKYAATWWDAVSVGQKGLNVGSAGAMDFFDMGPAFTGTNSTLASQDPTTRWGAATALHVGNLWNWGTGKLPDVLASHVHLVTLPNVTISPLFMWPHGTNVDKWTFAKDFQIAMAYRFGGTP